MIDPRELYWKGHELFYGRRRVASVVQDSKYPSMWRVQQPDGTLSDMVNLSRAKDAARSQAATWVKAAQEARQGVATASLARLNETGASTLAGSSVSHAS
jgi:hypothetical protein